MTLQEETKRMQQQRNSWQGVPTQLPEQPKVPEQPMGYYRNNPPAPAREDRLSQGLQQQPVTPPLAAQEPTYKGAYSEFAGQPKAAKPDTTAQEASGSYMDILRQYMPKPDYEQEKRNARRAQMGAFISDLANVVGKAGASAGGAWMIDPTQFRTPAAQAQYQDVLNKERAAYMDYGGRLANAAIKDMEAKKAADAMAAQNEWERYKFGVGVAQNQRDFNYKAAKDQRDYQYLVEKNNRDYELAVEKANRDYELGKISAKQRDRQINEVARHNKESEAIAWARIQASKDIASGKNNPEKKVTTVYLADAKGNKKTVSIPKDQANSVMGYIARRIRQSIGTNSSAASDYDAIMSKYSSADSNTKLQAITNLLGTKYRGLYEEVVDMLDGTGTAPASVENKKEDVSQWLMGGQEEDIPPLLED